MIDISKYWGQPDKTLRHFNRIGAPIIGPRWPLFGSVLYERSQHRHINLYIGLGAHRNPRRRRTIRMAQRYRTMFWTSRGRKARLCVITKPHSLYKAGRCNPVNFDGWEVYTLQERQRYA